MCAKLLSRISVFSCVSVVPSFFLAKTGTPQRREKVGRFWVNCQRTWNPLGSGKFKGNAEVQSFLREAEMLIVGQVASSMTQ